MHGRMLTLVMAIGALWTGAGALSPEAVYPSQEAAPGPYHQEPDDLWNRVHEALFTVRDAAGGAHGRDELDPIWGPRASSAFGDSGDWFPAAAQRRAVKVLDEFLSAPIDGRKYGALRGAFLQRDLWAAFDLLAIHRPGGGEPTAALRVRLARSLRRLALSEEEIRSLPANYAAAVAAGKWPASAPQAGTFAPYLPPDLLAHDGTWRCVAPYRHDIAARSHVSALAGRSAFTIRVRVPGGGAATDAYLSKLRAFPQPIRFENGAMYLSPKLPQLPVGAEVALVRQLLAIRDDGEIVPTPVVESVQIRVFREIDAPKTGCGGSLAPFQDAYEFRVDRRRLFANEAGGLVAIRAEDAPYAFFTDTHRLGGGPVGARRSPHLESCGSCHAQPGIYANPSFTGTPTGPGTILLIEVPAPPRGWTPTTPALQTQSVIAWKKDHVTWGVLRGLWDAGEPR